MDETILYVAAFFLGWIVVGTASAFIVAAAFFGIKEEKNLEENNHDL